jgi:hypothetical protein
MNIRRSLRQVVLGLSLPVLFLADLAPDGPLGLGFPREAAAIVGAPLTPVSVAGVARRTTRRVEVAETTAVAATATAAASQQQAVAQQQAAVAQQQQAVAQQQAATAQKQAAVAQQQAGAAAPAVGTVVASLPAGCAGVAKAGVEYYQCGSVYYRAAFQGNNLVYVVQQP